jgi:hypothetical protein
VLRVYGLWVGGVICGEVGGLWRPRRVVHSLFPFRLAYGRSSNNSQSDASARARSVVTPARACNWARKRRCKKVDSGSGAV